MANIAVVNYNDKQQKTKNKSEITMYFCDIIQIFK